MTHSLWHRLRQALHGMGWRVAILYLLHGLLQRVLPRSGLVCYHFLAQPVQNPASVGKPRGLHYTFNLLTGPDPRLCDLPRPEAVIAQRFTQGAHCLLATRDGALAGCIWWAHTRYCEDEVRVDYVLPKTCVWDFDVYVASQERLGFLFAKQWEVAQTLLRQRGTRFSLSRINALNPQSLSAHRRLGAVPVGWAIFLTVAGGQLMLSNLRPWLRFGGRPQLRVGAGSLAQERQQGFVE